MWAAVLYLLILFYILPQWPWAAFKQLVSITLLKQVEQPRPVSLKWLQHLNIIVTQKLNVCVCVYLCAHIYTLYVYNAAYCSEGFLSSLLCIFPQAWLEFNLTVSNFPSLAFNLFSSLWLLTLGIFVLTPPPPHPSASLPRSARAEPSRAVLNTETKKTLESQYFFLQQMDQLL